MLEHSLPAVLAQDPVPEVVVVDNASSDGTADLARRHGVRHLRLPTRLSYAAAINRAIGATDGGVRAPAQRRLLPASRVPGRGAARGWPSRASARWRRSCCASPLPASRSSRSTPRGCSSTVGARTDSSATAGRAPRCRPRARCSEPTVRRRCTGASTLEDCALPDGEVLDEDMELWASDADLAWRARLLGWRCVYEPRAPAEHVRTYSPSTRSRVSERARRLQFRNRLSDDGQERDARRAGSRRRADRRLRGRSRSGTCCCASAICSGLPGGLPAAAGRAPAPAPRPGTAPRRAPTLRAAAVGLKAGLIVARRRACAWRRASVAAPRRPRSTRPTWPWPRRSRSTRAVVAQGVSPSPPPRSEPRGRPPR